MPSVSVWSGDGTGLSSPQLAQSVSVLTKLSGHLQAKTFPRLQLCTLHSTLAESQCFTEKLFYYNLKFLLTSDPLKMFYKLLGMNFFDVGMEG